MAHEAVYLPSTENTVAPVTILDANGNLVRIVSAEEFRRDHPTLARAPGATHRGHRRAHE
jgi:PHD/YefM family antitoxin component YafN of YafNO toxin-antitoxin module